MTNTGHGAWRLFRASTIAAVLAAVTGAHAGTFSVSPVRIFMQARERATAVTIQNEGATELVMQAELFQWSQGNDGTDKLTPTEDLILAPPILRLGPGARQVVRLASLKPPPTGAQESYRLIVREVPEALPQAAGVNVQVALAFSLPVFITPPGTAPVLACTPRITASTVATVTCENSGRAYAQPVAMNLTLANGAALGNADIRGGYILPLRQRAFQLAGAAAPLAAGPGKLTVTLDDGSKQTFDVRLTD